MIPLLDFSLENSFDMELPFLDFRNWHILYAIFHALWTHCLIFNPSSLILPFYSEKDYGPMFRTKLADKNVQMGLLIAVIPFLVDLLLIPIQLSVCLLISFISALIMIIKPSLLSPVTHFWLFIGNLLGKIFSSIFLMLFYYTLITCLGIVHRFLPEGRLTKLPFDKMGSTWENRSHIDNDLRRQFWW